jgi:hypothetical protein
MFNGSSISFPRPPASTNDSLCLASFLYLTLQLGINDSVKRLKNKPIINVKSDS